MVKDEKMGRINLANVRRTLYYLRKNGLLATYYAVKERMEGEGYADYSYEYPSEETLQAQRARKWRSQLLFSIVVPAYRTPPEYLKEMMDSVLGQTYSHWELVLADATDDDSVEEVVCSYQDARIRYHRLERNAGIAGNSNFGVDLARGDYIGLLDHDDILAPDALYEVADRIEEGNENGIEKLLIYTDEDKCSQDGHVHYEPHFKEDFNLDLLLSNNYICHFTVIKSELMKKVKFRKEFEGAQDYDLILRVITQVLPREDGIEHIPKVLYHWRCHAGSTAANPQSKQYAYEAGRRAVLDIANAKGWKAEAFHLRHVGYYGLKYQPDMMAVRTDIGAVGGRLLSGGRITGGIYRKDGTVLYEGMHGQYSGYMHKAVLLQDVDAVDIRLVVVRPECRQIFQEVTGVPYWMRSGEEAFDSNMLPPDTDYRKVSLELGKALRNAGYRIVWNPSWSEEWK